MNKQELQVRLGEMQAQLAQLLRGVNIVSGSIDLCNQLIAGEDVQVGKGEQSTIELEKV